MNDILFQLTDILQQGRPFVLCMVTEASGSTPRKQGARMIVFGDGSIIGTIGGGPVELACIDHAKKVLDTAKPDKLNFKLDTDLSMQCGGNMEIYLEPFFGDSKLYIFGVGHIGREVGKLANGFGFSVIYIDHRPDIFGEFDCSYARCIGGDYVETAEKLSFNQRDYVVIATPKHDFDAETLKALAGKELAYLGMMGSKRKVAAIRKNLLENKQLNETQLAKVDMPIGIPIRCETPAEIALSIVAKLVDVKNSFN